ncbi:WUSCHEL related homeobox 13 isoform 1 [Hibiscus syriacus]|uniref:WUSCHEL related homeobox 13 isoform 1 n=1 Tax=Hibiscus syriacus TaxID=106335 RepID=A0A6A3B4V5_HIBSY|nr:uncharacterized protein LOC120118662 [Hibiscus syriacus]KAE8710089.1 WUSCHEL related homeobox 13 isoform 1 [Hibiscus syriacus]
MGKISMAYIHEGEWPPGTVDIHIVKKSLRKAVSVAILLLPFACIFLSFREISATLILWRLLLSGHFVILLLLLWNPVHKESVVIMPAFGVQLETYYASGRIIRRFIPAGEILKPVLLECVTPVTCYWSLSLLVRGKEELVLVFKELRPPMKMLLPVWKALCASMENKESAVTSGEVEGG